MSLANAFFIILSKTIYETLNINRKPYIFNDKCGDYLRFDILGFEPRIYNNSPP